MVLWELTAITAYFLGLRRTYRLALRIQRRLISRNHPRAREFVYRRVRDVFNVAVTVHKNIQERDIEVGRNLGNMILRWLDRMKPSAQIRPHPPKDVIADKTTLHASTSASSMAKKPDSKLTIQESNNRTLFSPLSIRPKPFQILPMMMQTSKSASANNQFRRLSQMPYSLSYTSGNMRRSQVMEGVFRKDIVPLMLQS